MSSSQENNKRIAKNTLLLYFRMLFMMLVSLYTSRVILNALGVEDFGIYNVVGGVVAMFTVLSGSLSAAISRFITYELGKGDQSKLNKIFSASVTIQLLLSLVIVVLVELVGVWFLEPATNGLHIHSYAKILSSSSAAQNAKVLNALRRNRHVGTMINNSSTFA